MSRPVSQLLWRESWTSCSGPASSGPGFAPTARNQVCVKAEVVSKVTGNEEFLPNSLSTRPTHFPPTGFVPQQLNRPVGGLLDGRHQVTLNPLLDLDSDADHVASDDRNPFPHRLADDESEPFAEGLGQSDVRLPLQDVHLEGADPAKVCEEMDVRIVPGVSGGPLEPQPALGVVL